MFSTFSNPFLPPLEKYVWSKYIKVYLRLCIFPMKLNLSFTKIFQIFTGIREWQSQNSTLAALTRRLFLIKYTKSGEKKNSHFGDIWISFFRSKIYIFSWYLWALVTMNLLIRNYAALILIKKWLFVPINVHIADSGFSYVFSTASCFHSFFISFGYISSLNPHRNRVPV